MRFTLVAASFGAMLLLLTFGFLLFKTPENKTPEVPAAVREVPTETQVSEDKAVVSPLPDVSQNDTRSERPLGTDINMEFPTLDE